LAINEKALGPDHPAVAISLNNLAWLLQLKGNYTEAEPLYLRAMAIDDKVLGPNHPNTRQVQRNLDSLRKKSGQATAPKPEN
jgi:hypothetical protein